MGLRYANIFFESDNGNSSLCLYNIDRIEISDQNFSHLDQFLCMAFAQLTYRESLREIELACTDFRSALSLPLAEPAPAKAGVELFFKMDQTASSDQAVLWHYRKCSALLYTIQQILSLILFDKTPLD